MISLEIKAPSIRPYSAKVRLPHHHYLFVLPSSSWISDHSRLPKIAKQGDAMDVSDLASWELLGAVEIMVTLGVLSFNGTDTTEFWRENTVRLQEM